MSGFQLDKAYFDLVDNRGRVFIGYEARLRWKTLILGYRGFIIYQQAQGIIEKGEFLFKEEPIALEGKEIFYRFGDVNGCWVREGESFKEALLDSAQGKIAWNCIQPRSEVSLNYNSDLFSGKGYLEKISLTIPPWKLPIQELYWGRFHSAQNTVVWIRWEGSQPNVWIYHNSKRVSGTVTVERISFGNFMLDLNNSVILRNDSIGNTLFRGFQNLMKLFPARILNLKETKWAGQGELKSGDEVEMGTVIHEKVVWQ